MPTGSFTNLAAQKYLDHIFGGNSKSSHSPYLGAFITTPSVNGPGTEPTGGGYNRVALNGTYFSESTTGTVVQLLDITFPRATANWGQIVGFGLFDSSVAGNCLVFWHAEDVEMIMVRDRLIVLAGGLTHTFISGLYSNYLKNLIMNDCYNISPIPIFPTLYAAYYSTTPTATAGGTEPTAGGYVRQAVANSAVNFAPWSGGSKLLSSDILFPLATADQGTMTHFGWHDSETGGQFLAGGALDVAKDIDLNDQFKFLAGEIVHTLI